MRAARPLVSSVFLLGLLLHAAVPARSESAPSPPTSPAPGAIVSLDGEPLFRIVAPLGPFSQTDRAKAIEERLTRLADDPLFSPEHITVVQAERGSHIVAGEMILLAVTETDAQLLGRPHQVVANEYMLKIRRAVERSRGEHSLRAVVIDSIWALVATLVFLAILKLLLYVSSKFAGLLESWRGTYIQPIRLQRVELLSAEQILMTLIGAAKMLKIAAIVVLAYFYLTSVLTFFPWTRPISAHLIAYVVSPLTSMAQAFVTHVPDVIAIVVIIFVTRYIVKLIHVVFNGLERGAISFPGFHRDWAEPTYKIVRFLVIAFAAIAIFPYVPGSSSPAFQGISVFLGVLFSLGSTGSISNIVSGIVLTYMRPFQLGDRVRIADTFGDVIGRELLVTRVRTIKNVDITIPNAMILSSHIINFSSSAKDRGLILHTSVTIGYDAPWRRVHELLISAAAATPDILGSPAPFVLQTSLNDFYVTYELNAYTDHPNRMASTYSRLHEQIQDKFNEAGIEIMSPHYTQIRDGNRTTIPDQYLPSGYAAPAFRISTAEGAPPRPNGEISAVRAPQQ